MTHSSLSQMEQPDFQSNQPEEVKQENKLEILTDDISPNVDRSRSPLAAETSLRSPKIPVLENQGLELEDIFLGLKEPEKSPEKKEENIADLITNSLMLVFMAEI